MKKLMLYNPTCLTRKCHNLAMRDHGLCPECFGRKLADDAFAKAVSTPANGDPR